MSVAEATLFYSTIGVFALVIGAITVGAVVAFAWGIEVIDDIKRNGW